jgi:hypothetical protein
MKVLYFNTHTTLNEWQAELCLRSISEQSIEFCWDKFFIYNTHPHEISNEKIMQLYNKYELNKKFKSVEVVPYDMNDPKTNFQDFQNMINHCKNNVGQSEEDYLLYVKSDYVLSRRFFEGIEKFNGEKNFIFSAMLYCTKEWVGEADILRKKEQDIFTLMDNETYYIGSDYKDEHPHDGGIPVSNTIKSYELKTHWNWSDGWFDKGGYKGMRTGPGSIDSPNHPSIKFVSSSTRGDVNIHYMTVNTFTNSSFTNSRHHTWGYWQAWNQHLLNGGRMLNVPESYCIHVWHEIISERRKEDRADPEKNVTNGQRY